VEVNGAAAVKVDHDDVGLEELGQKVTHCFPERILGFFGRDGVTGASGLQDEGQKGAILNAVHLDEPFDLDLEREGLLPGLRIPRCGTAVEPLPQFEFLETDGILERVAEGVLNRGVATKRKSGHWGSYSYY
jgi:hypothetical protein